MREIFIDVPTFYKSALPLRFSLLGDWIGMLLNTFVYSIISYLNKVNHSSMYIIILY